MYQIKVAILEIEPPVWRRLLVPENITFSKLHKIIQASFGWLGYHLYDFNFGDTVVFFPDPYFGPGELYGDVIELNPRGVKIDPLLRERKNVSILMIWGMTGSTRLYWKVSFQQKVTASTRYAWMARATGRLKM